MSELETKAMEGIDILTQCGINVVSVRSKKIEPVKEFRVCPNLGNGTLLYMALFPERIGEEMIGFDYSKNRIASESTWKIESIGYQKGYPIVKLEKEQMRLKYIIFQTNMGLDDVSQVLFSNRIKLRHSTTEKKYSVSVSLASS